MQGVPNLDLLGSERGDLVKNKNKLKKEFSDPNLEREKLLASIVESSDDAIIGKTLDGIVLSWNPGAEKLYGYSAEEMIGRSIHLLLPPDLPNEVTQLLERIGRGERVEHYETVRVTKEGRSIDISLTISPINDATGKVTGASTIARDITERKGLELELAKKMEVIQRQAQEILEISTPVMQVWEGVLVAPLIGTLDSQRTQQFMERLLERIVQTNSPVTLVDITGVPTIDTQTAQHLIDTISAVRLLGAQVILTGVRPAIAQTLVHLGVNLSDITTRSSLAAGLQVALDALGMQMVSKKDSRKEI